MHSPQTFQKVPVAIRAIQFDGHNAAAIRDFVGTHTEKKTGRDWEISSFRVVVADLFSQDQGVIAEVWDKLHETWVGVKLNQWIIEGVEGECYPCDHDVFRKTYQRPNSKQDESGYWILGPELFADPERKVICWEGQEYYKPCGEFVYEQADGTRSHCVKIENHPGHIHEAYDGTHRVES